MTTGGDTKSDETPNVSSAGMPADPAAASVPANEALRTAPSQAPAETSAAAAPAAKAQRLRLSKRTWMTLIGSTVALSAIAAGGVYLWMGQQDQAWQNCKSEDKRAPDQRIRDCGEVVLDAQQPKQTIALAYRLRARAFTEIGETASAIQDYSHALETIDKDATLWLERGNAQLQNGQPDEAQSDFAQAMAIDPQLVEPVIGRGKAYMALKEPEQAAGYFTLAISLKPNLPEPVYLRAITNVRMARIADAAADYDRALELAPKNPNYWNARCWFRGTQSLDLDLAISDCETALKIKPDFAPAMDSKAFVLLRLGKYQDAIIAYDRAIAAETRYAWPYFGRGLAKKRSGDEPGAEVDFAKARSIQDDIDEQYAAYGEAP